MCISAEEACDGIRPCDGINPLSITRSITGIPANNAGSDGMMESEAIWGNTSQPGRISSPGRNQSPSVLPSDLIFSAIYAGSDRSSELSAISKRKSLEDGSTEWSRLVAEHKSDGNRSWLPAGSTEPEARETPH
jgi:hypothetical protein